MKIFAILLVSAIGLYAIYELFKGNAALSAGLTPAGQITPAGQSTAGQPIYSDVAIPSSNAGLAIGAATSLAAAIAPTTVSDAFGAVGNQLDSSLEVGDSEATTLVTGSTTLDTAGS